MKEIYEYPNAYFRISDPSINTLHNFVIPDGFWSRKYEYPFAMRHAHAGQIVADMGMGWHYRPLHDALSIVCDFVFGVDSHRGILDLPPMAHGTYIVADFSQPIEGIPPASLDRIFCISVLEELINYQEALSEFKRLLKPDGLCIITCDVPYNDDKPAHEKYKGVKLDELEDAIKAAGLAYDGMVNRVKYDDLLHNDDFNLCVWHMTLKHVEFLRHA